MWKSASLAVLVGASAASLGTVWVMRQMKKSKDNAAYAQAMDEVLSQSDLLRRQETDGVREEIEKHLGKRKSSKITQQDSGSEQPEQQSDEPHPLSKSLKNFEEVVNSRVKIRDNSNNKNGQKKKKSTKEFTEFISKELQETAGANVSVCMQKLEEAAYVCIDCLADSLNNTHNNHKTLSTEGDRSDNEEENLNKHNQILQKNHLNCQLDQNKTTDSTLGVNSKQINRFATPIELTELLCRDCVKQLHKGHLAFNIFAKGGEEKFIRNQHYNSYKNLQTTFNHNRDEKQFENPTRTVTDREILIYGAVALAQEAGEILKMEKNQVNMFCSSYEQINLLEEDIPEEISTHLCQELNLIFDALLERVQKAESEELNALLRILLKRVQEIMGENNILTFIIGGILVKRNILDRILGADCLDGKNQSRLAEILLKIAKTDEQLRLQLAGLLLQHFKTVFISQSLTSLLVFLLKHPTLRANLPSILKKSSHFIAPLFNAKSILEKHELSKHKNKILRCFIIMRLLCQDQSLVLEGIIQHNYLKFTQAIADVAQLIENVSELDIRTNFLKNIIHTNLSQELLFLKELDFHVRLLFAQFAILAKNAQQKEKIMVSHKLQAYLMQNIHHLISEKQQGHLKNENKEQHESQNEKFKDQTDSFHKNQENLANNNSNHNIKGSSLIRVNLTSLNLLTILEKTLGVSTREIKFGEKAQTICRDYLFYISEGHELLQLEGVSHIINYPENRLMLEKLLFIYGLRCIGDFPLLVSLQQSGVAAESGATSFISEIFSETQSGCFDVYQNLRFLFTDACNQTTQLAVNIFQVNSRQLPLHQLFREILKYTSIHDAQDIISLCEVVKQSSGQIILDPIVKLKEEYYGSFYPLLFSKYPILFDKLIQEQDAYFNSNKKDKQSTISLNQAQQTTQLIDSDFLGKDTNQIINKKYLKSMPSPSASSIEQYITLGSSGILSSAGSSDFAYLNSSRLMEQFRVVTANNFSSRKNSNDVFGSDYDLFIVKDRLAAFHGRIAQKMNVAIRAFFLLDKNSKLSSHLTMIIQIYLRVLLFQVELLDKQSEKTSNNFLSSDLISKACTALSGYLNPYLLEDLQFVSSSQQQQLEQQQQSQKSPSPQLRKYKSYFK